MSSRPKNIYPSVKPFKGADFTLPLQMFEGFTPPDAIVTEVWDKQKFKYNIPSTYNAEENKIEVPWTAEQLQKMGAINEFYIRFDNEGETSVYRFGGEIKPSYSASDTETSGYAVTAEYVVVEVLGMDLVKEQVDLAYYYSIQASQLYFDQGPYNAATNTPTLTADATIGQQGEKMSRYKVTVGGVLNFAGENFTAGTSVASYDELIQLYNGKWYLVPGPFTPSADITVQNYADAVPYFTGDTKRRVYVTTDFSYNEGNESFYDWIPGRGEYFLGLDANYKEI